MRSFRVIPFNRDLGDELGQKRKISVFQLLGGSVVVVHAIKRISNAAMLLSIKRFGRISTQPHTSLRIELLD